MTGHPRSELLVGNVPEWVEAHVRDCPLCRIDQRLLLQADTFDAEEDEDALGIFEAVRARGLPDPSTTWRSSAGSAADSRQPVSTDAVDLLHADTDLGRYTVEGLLGRGGMAAVYLVRHNDLGTQHALKVVLLPTRAMRERLLREGRAQGALRHPNIVAVTDTVTVAGSPGLVVELVQGPSLDDVLLCELLPLAAVDTLAADILAGVGAAHAAGFVHRDLKPANVLLSLQPGGVTAKVADFGLVKAVRGSADAAGSVRTRTGTTLGTPAYMAPEQIRDASRVDARTDVFAIGAILYELITGVRAFGGRDTLEVFNRVTEGRPTEIDTLRADVPPRMQRAVDAALRKDPADRPNTVEELWEVWTDGQGQQPRHVWSEASLDRIEELRSVQALPTSASNQPSQVAPTIALADAPPESLLSTLAKDEVPHPSPAAPIWRNRRLQVGTALTAAVIVAAVAGAVSLEGPPVSTVPEQLTGAARVYRLDGGEGVQMFPSLGPHGEVVVFSDGVDLFSRRVGATTTHLLTGSFEPHATQPSVSPDGGRIALSANGAIWVMDERGDNPRELAARGYWPSWSPDGGSIVYATGDEGDIWVGRQHASEVWSLDVTSGERIKIADYGLQPAFRADGQAIAYFNGDEVEVVRVDGSELLGETKTRGASQWHPVFDDQGMFTLSNRGAATSLLYFETPDSEPAPVMTLPITWGFDVQGRRVVADLIEEDFAILEVNLDDNQYTMISSLGAPTSPAFGPDGQRALVKYQSPERLVLVAADGTEKTLAQGGSFRSPAFSPDGQHLTMSADYTEGYGTYILDLDGANLGRLAPGNLGPTHWSPDGKRISWSNGQPQITAIDTPAEAWGIEEHDHVQGFWAGAFSPSGDTIIVRSPEWTLHTLDVRTFALSRPVVEGSDAAWLDEDTWLVANRGELVRVQVSTGERGAVVDLAPWRVSDQPSLAVRGQEVLVGVRRIKSARILVGDFPGAD